MTRSGHFESYYHRLVAAAMSIYCFKNYELIRSIQATATAATNAKATAATTTATTTTTTHFALPRPHDSA